MDLNLDVCSLAVAKAIKDGPKKAARENIKPGRYPVAFAAKITGAVTVNADSTQTIYKEVDYKAALTRICTTIVRQYGVDIGMMDDLLRSLIADESDLDTDIADVVETIEKEVKKQSYKRPTKGRVTTNLQIEFEEIDEEAEEAAEAA